MLPDISTANHTPYTIHHTPSQITTAGHHNIRHVVSLKDANDCELSELRQVVQNIKFKENRNTKFIIKSLKGRNISQFSTFYGEKEVLFTPFSRFLVIG
jgi:hypothetical protein